MKALAIIMALALFICTNVYAFEPVPITVSSTMDKVIFDGKWTFEYEWKASSLNTYQYDNNTQIVLRSAYEGNFVYIFLDAITDFYPDKLNDYAIICFDTKNDKSDKSNLNDYCFKTTLDGKNGLVYQGGSQSVNMDYNNIQNPVEFVGIGAISDTNDRYTIIPHPSYEFRIPTSLIGRESVYGFYFSVYDDHLKKSYTYPVGSEPGSFVSSPSQWGEIYSPDKSLPEFELPLFLMALSVFPIIFLAKTKYFGKISK